MGKKVREYKSGDFIFAKVKGYPAWPARVQKMNGKKYFVYFYGTGETANLPPNMIFDYAENKDKFLTKTVKRRDFNDGVKQIEHDFANNVPLEQVIGAIAEPPAEANDSANDTGNSTMDDTMADTTAADETVDEIAANTTQNENAIEDSDEAGPLVIDEGKKGGKSKADAIKTPAKEAAKAKEPKTPRGKAKKEEAKEEEEAKKEEEIVSRSGRKIRPKRYIDEQTEENTTLPSPVPKKKRAVSPPPAEKDGDKEKEKAEPTKEKPAAKLFNAVTQSELEGSERAIQTRFRTSLMMNLVNWSARKKSERDWCAETIFRKQVTVKELQTSQENQTKIVPQFAKTIQNSNSNVTKTKKFVPPTKKTEETILNDPFNSKTSQIDCNNTKLTKECDKYNTTPKPIESKYKDDHVTEHSGKNRNSNPFSGLIFDSINILNEEEMALTPNNTQESDRTSVKELDRQLSHSSVASLKVYKDLDSKSFENKLNNEHKILEKDDYINLFLNKPIIDNFKPVGMSIVNGDMGFNMHYADIVKNSYVNADDNDENLEIKDTLEMILKMYPKENKFRIKKNRK
ncbi:hypothetical protein evm_008809 [Chilo suppressalis]|nr:hypothetical protein evm_008809 [Chilo suppressalis]